MSMGREKGRLEHEIRISKSEARNKLKIRLFEFEKQRKKKERGPKFFVLSFEFVSLDIVSDFVFRISNLARVRGMY